MNDRPQFIVDQNVGKLTKLLRLLGYDTIFFTGETDAQMVEIALAENRIILTRDTHILERRAITSGQVKALLLGSDNIEEQIRQVVSDLHLDNFQPFTICLEDNRAIDRPDAGRGKKSGASLCLGRLNGICGMPSMPPHLLERHPLGSHDPQTGKTYLSISKRRKMEFQRRYVKLTPELISQLKEIVGEKNVLIDKGKEDYSRDESPHPQEILPEVVIKPESPAIIAKVLQLASQNKIPVTPRGAGTGLSGGSVPIFGGISLSLEKLNRIIEIDESNFCVTAESGVTLDDLCTAVEQRNLYLPLYPGEKSATIGGNVSTNAGGMRAVRYGVTRNFVLGVGGDFTLPGKSSRPEENISNPLLPMTSPSC